MIHNADVPDCGDNGCQFAPKRGGMRTNGGCRCIDRRSHISWTKVERYAVLARQEIPRLEASLLATREALAAVFNLIPPSPTESDASSSIFHDMLEIALDGLGATPSEMVKQAERDRKVIEAAQAWKDQTESGRQDGKGYYLPDDGDLSEPSQALYDALGVYEKGVQ